MIARSAAAAQALGDNRDGDKLAAVVAEAGRGIRQIEEGMPGLRAVRIGRPVGVARVVRDYAARGASDDERKRCANAAGPVLTAPRLGPERRAWLREGWR